MQKEGRGKNDSTYKYKNRLITRRDDATVGATDNDRANSSRVVVGSVGVVKILKNGDGRLMLNRNQYLLWYYLC